MRYVNRRVLWCAWLPLLLPMDAAPQQPPIRKILTVSDCAAYETRYATIDSTAVVRRPDFDRYLLFYGAITARRNLCTCTQRPPGATADYTQDIWLTWSRTEHRDQPDNTTDGFGEVFDQAMLYSPPMPVLNSSQLQQFCASNPTVCESNASNFDPRCVGWHVGDPGAEVGTAIASGPEGPGSYWYLYFNTQNCTQAQPPCWRQNGIFVATTNNLFDPTSWRIRGRVDNPPSTPGSTDCCRCDPPLPPTCCDASPCRSRRCGYGFPSLFKNPSDNNLYLYYTDATANAFGVRIVNDGIGLTSLPIGPPLPGDDGAAPPVIRWTTGPWIPVSRIAIYYDRGQYYAIVDEGPGPASVLTKLWRLGPSSFPYNFTGENRQPLLTRGVAGGDPWDDWFSSSIGYPAVVSSSYMPPSDTGLMIYFSGQRTYEPPGCGTVTHSSVGLLRERSRFFTSYSTVAGSNGPELLYVPCRFVDTRTEGGALGPGETRVVARLGNESCFAHPLARALSANVTITQGTSSGAVSVYPADLSFAPGTSLPFSAGRTRATATIIKVSDDPPGRIAIHNRSAGFVQVIIDINGYFW